MFRLLPKHPISVSFLEKFFLNSPTGLGYRLPLYHGFSLIAFTTSNWEIIWQIQIIPVGYWWPWKLLYHQCLAHSNSDMKPWNEWMNEYIFLSLSYTNTNASETNGLHKYLWWNFLLSFKRTINMLFFFFFCICRVVPEGMVEREKRKETMVTVTVYCELHIYTAIPLLRDLSLCSSGIREKQVS